MSTTDVDETTTDQDADRAGEQHTDQLELAARAELLEKENQRLRAEYTRARQSQYHRTAAGLALIGILAVGGGLLFPDGRNVLFALAAVGVFGGVLTYYLTPGTFVAADVSERIYAALAANEAAIADELGLGDTHIYLPGADEFGPRLYVPQQTSDDLPDDLEGPILTDPDHRGLALKPTGATLFDEFKRTLTADLVTTPEPLATQLTDGLVEQFELVDSAESDVDLTASRATIAISDSAFGDVNRFDHPIASFLAVGFAAGLEQPIHLAVTPGDERSDWLVTCRWDTETSEETAATIETEESATNNTENEGDESEPVSK
ncbi:hypothetical protein [Natrinema sp. H-ect4]|uniref:hypothetical protein n=1 Tax=Natrinema sp. H-ect4 TaxID=3242699 RepID=UPI0035A87424